MSNLRTLIVGLSLVVANGTGCSDTAADSSTAGSSGAGALPASGGSGAAAAGGSAGAGPGGSGGAGTGGAVAVGSGGASAGSAGTGGAQAGSGGSATGGAGNGGAGAGGTGAGGEPTTRYLSELCELGDSQNAWGPVEKNASNGEQAAADGGPLTIANTIFSRGIGVHAPADVGYALNGSCTTFAATVGIDDEMRDAGSVVFEVWGDGTRRYQSGVVTGTGAPLAIEVDVRGIQELRLVAADGGGNGSDHADWADARVSCTGSTLAVCEVEPGAVTVPAGYRLVWSDEFDVEGRPDPASWKYENGFVRNEEAQWYQADNARVQAGFLIIEGRRERVPNPNYQAGSSDWKLNRQYAEYTSSSLLSSGLRSFQYGRFELRARIPARAGLWPAWWTLGVSGEWPSNGEIDIMEYYGGRVRANVATGTTTRWTAKWDSVDREVSSFGVADWDAKFHVWRMDWDAQSIALYLDGEQMNTTNLDDMLNPNGESPFRQPHYMLINLAMGGPAGGDPSPTPFPVRYEVDYVRVFQRQ